MTGLRLGTRGSPLALWQAHHVADLLRAADSNLAVELEIFRTRAENFPDQAIEAIGVGIFTKELDDALLDGRIDIAVHSSKDMPSLLTPGIALAAILERESPLDAWVAADATPLRKLPEGARIGSGSPRRRAQILALRPDLEFVQLRGNVDTRLRKIRDEGLAGTLLAHAGLRRLGREDVITELLDPDDVVPAVGQGAVAIAVSSPGPELLEALCRIEHLPSRWAVDAERSFLRELRGGCQVPAGALATVAADRIELRCVIASPDGRQRLGARGDAEISSRGELGRDLGRELLEAGGSEILAAMRESES